jgi:CRP-like cAMP-binding protein
MDFNLTFNPLDVICHQGDPSYDLYYLREGRLLICTVQGTQVKVIARIEPGEFIGELSFFDGKPRATHVVALEKSVVTKFRV